MRFFFGIVAIVLSAASVMAANSCSVGGIAGSCVSTTSCASSGGTSTKGYCPNDPNDVRCCTYGTCKSNGVPGKCVSTSSCSGKSIAGLCPGPTNIQCCIPTSTSFEASAVIAAARKRLGTPYVWGGGHAGTPGPSIGTCVGYTGSIKPCPADHTVGFDCSGLVRDALYYGAGIDLGHGGNTKSQLTDSRSKIISYADRKAGDIEFFGPTSAPYHVILYIGKNSAGKDMMIEAQKTGTNVHEVALRTGGTWVRVH
ncbi:hypothetical protein BGZ80_008866 [Entomortierella chlamydospora]|uniref:NlpC/P60 domain-containing protein n=1 Tax=Entomortierella chlamydospora TaxID=101097 RepID=A0A9P6T0W3_9FUNG|nr:hypothetical protein BGZ79_003047 [Entomortierella chlamydospora]KAG0016849.1 hypothetical protein BGZ80_008866 [Entomortierella chlamydospora]